MKTRLLEIKISIKIFWLRNLISVNNSDFKNITFYCFKWDQLKDDHAGFNTAESIYGRKQDDTFIFLNI